MSPAEETGGRLARLLAMVPYIGAQGLGATVEELVERFGADARRITRDLELLSAVEADGLHGVRIWEEDGRWFVDQYGLLGEQLRLTAVEGLAITAASKALLDVPGMAQSTALSSALEKLRTVLEGIEGLDVDLDEPPFLGALRAAAKAHERVTIRYYGAAADELKDRKIEPVSVFNAGGRWHVLAYCHLAEGERDFRVDRIRAVQETGEHFEPRTLTMQPGLSFQPASTTAVTIEIGPTQRWALDSYPVRDVQQVGDQRWRFTVDVGGTAWLEQLLLRLGAGASVVGPGDLCDVAVDAARTLLQRYASGPHATA